MRPEIHRDLTTRLKADFRFKKAGGAWLQQGQCPDCSRWEVYTRAEAPWVLKCSREDKCGWERHVKELFPEIFDSWSERFPPTEASPTATADAYLVHNRGLDLLGLRGAYTQEAYFDARSRESSATVRFPLPDGSWWERLIDRPGRFGKMKARFMPGRESKGDCWIYPGRTIDMLAKSDEIWFTEGIFDAVALEQGAKVFAATVGQNNVYPAAFLEQLRGHVRGDGPTLVFAFDVGPSGVKWTRKWVERAKKEGWNATAAQVRPDGDGNKLDWNDLHQLDRLKPEDLDRYRFNGALTVAESAQAKAVMIAEKTQLGSFNFTFRQQTFWGRISWAKVQEVQRTQDLSREEAIRNAVNVERIANVVFRTLYCQRDEVTDETAYFLSVDFPDDRKTVKSGFSPAALSAAAEFTKRLLTVGAGAWWTGSSTQLQHILEPQAKRLKTVEAILFTGYSAEHGCYVLGDLAVKDGHVHQLGDNDYFEIGKLAIKLKSSTRMLRLDYEPHRFDYGWLPFLWTAYRERGLVALTFWFASFFAEQVRGLHKSFPFLEMWGDPGAGKTTLVEFLWKMCGRENHEGIDPQRATAAGLARTLANVGNMPIVLMEGDRSKDSMPHRATFDWEELKSIYHGRSTRTVGKKTSGLDTDSSPFRGAIVIEQNDPVNASRAVRSRICSMHFSTDGFTRETKAAADRIESWPMESLSGFLVHAVKAEREVLARFAERYTQYESELLAREDIRDQRVAKCHAQLLAMFDAMQLVVPITGEAAAAVPAFIRTMATERQLSLTEDHPIVERFWEVYDFLEASASDSATINHSVKPDATIAVNLTEFEQRAANNRLDLECSPTELRKHLRTSKSRRFLAAKNVRSRIPAKGVLACFVFETGARNRGDGQDD